MSNQTFNEKRQMKKTIEWVKKTGCDRAEVGG